jgi:deoxyribonuclease V
MSYKEAAELQRELAGRIFVRNELPDPLRTVAGVDVSYEKHGDLFFAAVVVLSFPDLEVFEEASASGRVDFPYIPGLLSFRELPIVLEAFRCLETVPGAVLVDGQGIAHPRGLGIASHLGLWLDLPTIGCAKSRLCGRHAEPGRERGERAELLLGDDQVGTVLRTRDGVRPLYISPGHKVDHAAAVDLVLACGRKTRMPEPTRLAHLLTNRLRMAGQESKIKG